MHRLFRNRFLGSAAFLSGPDDPPSGGNGASAGDDQNNNGGAAGDDQGQQPEQGQEGAGADDEGGDQDGGESDDEDGGESDDEEDPLAGLSEEQRAKVQKALQREIGWRDRQINRLHAKTRSAQEDVEAARTITERVAPGAAAPAAGTQPTLTEAEVERRARQLTAQEAYDNGCNDTDAKGRDYYPNWADATAKLRRLGGIDQADMVNILATDHPAVVLYELQRNPEEYERIMALPPARRNNAFVKLALKGPPKRSAPATESKRPSDAPPPPRVLNGGRRQAQAGQPDLYNDKIADDAWYAARNATRRKKFSAVE